jgi:hypothetical protein
MSTCTRPTVGASGAACPRSRLWRSRARHDDPAGALAQPDVADRHPSGAGPPTQLPAQETVLFDQVGERLPLAALQLTGQDQQEHLDGCRGDHEREPISQPAVFARHQGPIELRDRMG